MASIFKLRKIRQQEGIYLLLHDGFLLGLFVDPEDGGDVFLRKVS
jgi:hypothetical protein